MPQDVNSGAGQEHSGYGLDMAGRRYQHGSVRLRGEMWYGRWREDIRQPDGTITRIPREEILGSRKELRTKKLAQREMESRLQEVNSVTYRPRTVSSFDTFCDRWEKSVMVNHKRSAQSSEKSINKVWLRPRWGSLQLKEMEADPEASQAWASSLDVEPKTQRNIVKHLRRILDVAIEWGYIKYNPLVRVKLKPLKLVDDEFALSLEQIRKIINAAPEPWKTMYWILGETGIRSGEVLALGWEHVDLEERILYIRRKLWRGEFETVKSKKGVRSFALSQQIVDHLKPIAKTSGQLFPDVTYDHALKEVFQPLLVALKIPKCGFHAFRHGNASVMDQENVPAKTRMDRLGHEKLDTTMGYTHAVSEDDRRFANRMGELLTERVQ